MLSFFHNRQKTTSADNNNSGQSDPYVFPAIIVTLEYSTHNLVSGLGVEYVHRV